jgi:hypothetical protein
MRGREAIAPKRRIPAQFSWVDHRLVRDGHIRGRSAEGLALYLFLVTVADADGLSWYSESALCRMLGWPVPALHHARHELREAGLIAYRKPLYQVLDISAQVAMGLSGRRSGRGEAVAIGDILRGLSAGGAQ